MHAEQEIEKLFLFWICEVAVSMELPEDEHTIWRVVNRDLSKNARKPNQAD
jgi:hypothetical protein